MGAEAVRPVLELAGVGKFYGPKLVFKNVSLSLAPGEVLLVAGPNGAGKSTLLKVMTGLARPDAGTVRLGVPKERVAYLGHATFIYPSLTAAANLEFWAGLSRLDVTARDIMAVLDRVGLKAAAEERAGVFSRGMAQRLNLARVFLLSPDLIFLDEPGTGLDVKSMGVLSREIEAARARGATLVWVSHDLRRDLALADRALFLADRKVAYLGPAASFPLEEAC